MNMTFISIHKVKIDYITFMALPLMKYTFFVTLDEINDIFVPKDLNIPGLQIRVRIGKLSSLFLIQNICCGYSKESSQ